MVSSKPINAGFTLMEMLIVIAIMAILAAIALPGMQRTVATQRANNRADQLFSLFQFARAEAIRTNQPVLICPTLIRKNAATSNGCVKFGDYDNGNGWQGFMAFNDKNMNGEFDDGDSAIRVVAVNQNADYKLGIKVNVCKSQTCTNIGGTHVLGFMPNGQFGTGSGKDDWTIGQSNVVFQINDVQYTDITRRVVVTPSGKPLACYDKNGKNFSQCSLGLI